MMSAIVGGLMTCGGVLKLFDAIGKGTHYLGKNIQVNHPDDNKCKQISRIVSNVFSLIGHFCIAIGMITMGATIYSALPAIGFLGAVNEGLIAAAPYLISSLAGLSLGLIIRQAAR
jgi:hypothetical protein